MTRHWDKIRIGLLIILIIGGFIRFWGIDFGLPYLYHPDEFALISPAINILQTADFNPHRFDYGSLYIYLQTIVLGLYFIYGRSRGIFTSIHDIPLHEFPRDVYIFNYPGVYIAGRALTAIFGILTIILVYRIGCRMMNRWLGLIAALFLAFLPLHVINSHFITTDIPVTFFMTASLLFAFRIMKQGTWHNYIFAGLFAGLATSTKYPGGMIILAMIMAHFLRQKQGFEITKLFVGGVTAIIVFFFTTPFALLDMQEWLHWLTYVRNVYNPPGDMLEGASVVWYLTYLLQYPIVFITVPAVMGIFWPYGYRRQFKEHTEWILIVFVVAFFTIISLQKIRHPRALIPLLPSLALLAGWFVVNISATFQKWDWLKQRTRGQLAISIALLLVAASFTASIGHALRFTQKSARSLTREWVMENLQSGSKIATDFAAPVFPPGHFEVDRVGWTILAHDLAWYQQEGFDFLIITETTRFSINRTIEQEAQYEAFFNSDALILATDIKGPLLSYPDHHLWVYKFEQQN